MFLKYLVWIWSLFISWFQALKTFTKKKYESIKSSKVPTPDATGLKDLASGDTQDVIHGTKVEEDNTKKLENAMEKVNDTLEMIGRIGFKTWLKTKIFVLKYERSVTYGCFALLCGSYYCNVPYCFFKSENTAHCNTSISFEIFFKEYLFDGKVKAMRVDPQSGNVFIDLWSSKNVSENDTQTFGNKKITNMTLQLENNITMPENNKITSSENESTTIENESPTCKRLNGTYNSDEILIAIETPLNVSVPVLVENDDMSSLNKTDKKCTILLQIGNWNIFETQLKYHQTKHNATMDFIFPEIVPILAQKNRVLAILMELLTPILFLIYLYYKVRDLEDFPFGVSAGFKVVRPQKIGVKFSDIAGCQEAKIEIMEFVNILRKPMLYKALGARMPKGALLEGLPGTGKTLLAKAVANEAGVSFISCTGSQFVEVYVGVGPQRVRSLFRLARKNTPCIIYIDEIDAIGGRRENHYYAESERNSTLNQLLAEMDGFEVTNKPLIVLASTNMKDTLDKALLRPGRFDRHINITPPTIKGRADVFQIHLKPYTTANDKKELSKKLAALTPGFTGADIANICNEAALIAARDECKAVEDGHYDQAIDRVIGGLERKSNILKLDEKKTVAYHEAGHVVAGWFLEFTPVLLKVSLVSRGKALGFSQYNPGDRYLRSKEEIFDELCTLMGGRVAEQLFFNRITTGAVDDLQKATELAKTMVSSYGMSDKLGLLSFTSRNHNKLSSNTISLIEMQAKEILDVAYKKTLDLLTEHKNDIEKIAQRLLKTEVIIRSEIQTLLGKRPFTDLTTYEEFVEGTGSEEENKIIPIGLQDDILKAPEHSKPL